MATTNDAVTSDSTAMETLLGHTLLVRTKQLTKTKIALQDKDLVLLYFSASWCPPCQSFSPVLKEFYNVMHKTEKIEVIYVSSDRTVEEFESYYGKMPWLSIPMENTEVKRNLASMLQIRGIPALIVLEVKTGKFITSEARNHVQAVGGNPSKYKDVVKAWKSTTPVPIEQGIPSQTLFSIQGIITTLLKNPAYIFGLLYIVKWLLKQLNTSSSPELASADTIVKEVIEDNEF